MNAPAIDPATGQPVGSAPHAPSVPPATPPAPGTPYAAAAAPVDTRRRTFDSNGVPLPMPGVGMPGQSPAQIRASQADSGLPQPHPDGYVAPATVVLKAPPVGGAAVVAGLPGVAAGTVAGLPGTSSVEGTDRHLSVPAGTAGLPNGVPHEDPAAVRGPAVTTAELGQPDRVISAPVHTSSPGLGSPAAKPFK